MSGEDRPVLNGADKVGIFLAFLVGPVLWWQLGDWEPFAGCALVGVMIGVIWGTPPRSPQRPRDGQRKDPDLH